MKYRTIVADPPWPYANPGDFRASPTERPNSWATEGKTAGSAQRYGALSVAEIAGMCPPADDDAHLYLWTTNAFLEAAHAVCRSWGFRPITLCTYGKVTHEGRPSMKSGYYFRGATEHWVFGVRGSLPLQVTEALPTLWLWPRLPHSVKPDAFYDLVEKASPGPYLELFARRQRLGWDTWGDEALNHVEISA